MFDELGIADKRKVEIGRLCKIYQGETQMPPTSDIKKLFPCQYFVESPVVEDDKEFNERSYNAMRPAFEGIIEDVSNEYIRNMANFIGSILNDNTYIARFYIDVIIILGKSRLDSETVVRIRIVMNILRDFALEVRSFLSIILQSYKENLELLMIIKQELLTCLQDLKDHEAEEYIKQF